MSQPSKLDAVVIDANVLIGICTKETKEQSARPALADYVAKKWKFHAPNVIIPEFLHIACKKVDEGKLTVAEYETAIDDFNDYMMVVLTPPNSDAPFIKRASEIRKGYGCSRSNDAIYLALRPDATISCPIVCYAVCSYAILRKSILRNTDDHKLDEA